VAQRSSNLSVDKAAQLGPIFWRFTNINNDVPGLAIS
jgi:hypothetical protein